MKQHEACLPTTAMSDHCPRDNQNPVSIFRRSCPNSVRYVLTLLRYGAVVIDVYQPIWPRSSFSCCSRYLLELLRCHESAVDDDPELMFGTFFDHPRYRPNLFLSCFLPKINSKASVPERKRGERRFSSMAHLPHMGLPACGTDAQARIIAFPCIALPEDVPFELSYVVNYFSPLADACGSHHTGFFMPTPID